MKHPCFALDLGTTKFCLATLSETPTLHLKTLSTPAAGMRRGMVSDIPKVEASLNTLIDLAINEFGTDISRVVIGVAGSHLTGRTISTAMDLTRDQVSVLDMEALTTKVEQTFKLAGREIIHVVPVTYQVDDRPTTTNPVGQSGRQLLANFFLIEANSLYLKDVVSLCNRVGLEIGRIYAEPFASAVATLDDDRKDLGVALCDIGGGTTDGIIFINGMPVHLFTVNIAGKMMTQDIALGLNIPYDEAEQLKIGNNIVLPTSNFTLTATDVNGKMIEVPSSRAQSIIIPRLVELGRHIDRAISPWKSSLGAGLVLTGGGSEVSCIHDLLNQVIKLPTSRISPRVATNAESFEVTQRPSPKLATALGMLMHERNLRQANVTPTRQWMTPRPLRGFFSWLKELS